MVNPSPPKPKSIAIWASKSFLYASFHGIASKISAVIKKAGVSSLITIRISTTSLVTSFVDFRPLCGFDFSTSCRGKGFGFTRGGRKYWLDAAT
jgi:hypothetical protein